MERSARTGESEAEKAERRKRRNAADRERRAKETEAQRLERIAKRKTARRGGSSPSSSSKGDSKATVDAVVAEAVKAAASVEI